MHLISPQTVTLIKTQADLSDLSGDVVYIWTGVTGESHTLLSLLHN